MLWYPRDHLVIVTPPHTASGNLSMAAPLQHQCILVNGPCIDGNVDHHYAALSSSFDARTRVACVWREPKERTVGLWRHYNWYAEMKKHDLLEWDEFIDLISTDSSRLSWFYRWSIARLLDYHKVHVHEWLNFKTLERDVIRFTGRPFEMIPDNALYEKEHTADWHWKKHHSDKLNSWLQSDYELLIPF